MRFFEFRQILTEGDARIDHAEDYVIFQGSKGAAHALESLKRLEQGGHSDTTIKWDGSPAIIFGRNENGEFTLTDKSGFGAKGYDGKATSRDALQKMLMARPGARNPDPKKAEDYKQFIGNMKGIFNDYAKAVPKDHVGYFKGDLLYFTTPPQQNDTYVFTPNIVTYTVKASSDIGKRIGQSKTGVVIHRQVDAEGNESPINIDVNTYFEGNEVLVFPPVSVSKAPKVIDSEIDNLKVLISKNASALDDLLNKEALRQLKLTAFSDILYRYVNNKVDTGLENLGADFTSWLASSKVSKPMQERIITYITEHRAGFQSLWAVVVGIQKVKNDIIDQFDNHESDIKASIGNTPGGEGYVLSSPAGDMKLVNRSGFTAANRAIQR